MNPIVLFSVCLVLTTLTACSGRPAEPPTVGKYTVSNKLNNDDGKYRPVQRNEGRYIHMVEPYVHVHDNRELGQYVHIPNPYDGGYGPYSGLNNPYRHDESGNYDKYTTTSTTTRRPTTTTTTTVKPRLFNYFEEGGWKILRQEEEKEKHKYDFLYHTENGIYGEEKAHLHPGAGTAATGYYEYTGDDGELYRVNYKSDHRGFIPEGDHIPTPPPVPDAIKRALEYVAKKKETHGHVQTGQYEHKVDPIRRQNMPTVDRPLIQQQPAIVTQQPRALPPLPTLSTSFIQQQPIVPQQPRALPPLPALGSSFNQQQPIIAQQPRALPPLPALGSSLNQQQPIRQQPLALPPLPTLAPLALAPRFTQYSGNNQYDALPTIAPQNAPQSAYQVPSLSYQRPADQQIQQSQLAQQSQPDKLPQVQVLLPQVQNSVVEIAKPVQVVQLSSAPVVQLPQKVEVTPVPVQEVKAIEQVAAVARDEEELPQSDQPQSDQPEPQPESQPQQQSELNPKEEIPIKENDQMKAEQSIQSVVVAKPDNIEIEPEIEPDTSAKNQEISPEASETDNTFQPPYQVPEQLKDESNFEEKTD